MRKLLAIGLLLLICGCRGTPKYVDGQCLQIGLYIPTTDTLVGLQVMNWLSGVSITAPTNMPFTITRDYAATNTYFGVVNVNERIRTEVKVNETAKPIGKEEEPKEHF